MSVTFTSPHRLSGMPPDTPLLVAFSGGADSRLLLELTVRWARRNGAPVTAAHLHHGIRGAEADRDQAFCRDTAARLGVPFVTRRVDVPALAARTGRSVEWEARAARYGFLTGVMQEEHIPLLLTAHHADDQLETLLLRLLRGSGTRGLGGIPPVRPVPGGLVIRPLLGCTRADILETCRRMGLDYVTDSTNLADDCTRNRLRHRVIPLLEELSGPGVPQRAAVRLCRAAREDDDCLWQGAQALSPKVCGEDGSLSQAALCALPPAYAKRCLLAAYEQRIQAPLPADRTLTAAHLEALMTLVSTEGNTGIHADAEVLLPGGWRGRLREGRLVFVPPEDADGDRPDDRPDGSASDVAVPLRLAPGKNRWHPGRGEDTVILLEESPAPLSPCTGEGVLASAVFPAALPRPLWARKRRPGDTLLSHGMTKKLKKVLCDKHIPLPLRDCLPLICLPAEPGDSADPPGEAGPGQPLWFPTAIFRDGWAPPADGPCLRLTVLSATAPDDLTERHDPRPVR